MKNIAGEIDTTHRLINDARPLSFLGATNRTSAFAAPVPRRIRCSAIAKVAELHNGDLKLSSS